MGVTRRSSVSPGAWLAFCSAEPERRAAERRVFWPRNRVLARNPGLADRKGRSLEAKGQVGGIVTAGLLPRRARTRFRGQKRRVFLHGEVEWAGAGRSAVQSPTAAEGAFAQRYPPQHPVAGVGSEIWRVRVRFDGDSAWTRALLTHNRYREQGSSASAIHAPSVFRVEDGHIGGEASVSLGGGGCAHYSKPPCLARSCAAGRRARRGLGGGIGPAG